MTPFTEEDLRYLRAQFVPLEALCEREGRGPSTVCRAIAHRQLPLPTYVTPDGIAWVPADHLALWKAAGRLEAIYPLFVERMQAEGRRERIALTAAEIEQTWNGYITGGFGACLREVTPENMVRKEHLVQVLTGQLAAPQPEDPEWCVILRSRVEALDALERPFAPYDRLRFGGPVTRDRLITAARTRFPHLFAPVPSARGARP